MLWFCWKLCCAGKKDEKVKEKKIIPLHVGASDGVLRAVMIFFLIPLFFLFVILPHFLQPRFSSSSSSLPSLRPHSFIAFPSPPTPPPPLHLPLYATVPSPCTPPLHPPLSAIIPSPSTPPPPLHFPLSATILSPSSFHPFTSHPAHHPSITLL